MKPAFECSCESCSAGCTFKPGWFLPGEVEETAEYLSISLQELFDKKLGVDWWMGKEEGDTFLLAPALTTMSPGSEYPGDPRGACIFYKDEKCEIHPAKPFECAMYRCDTGRDEVKERHKSTGDAWKDHQDQIVKLLGRAPMAEYDTTSLLSLIWG